MNKIIHRGKSVCSHYIKGRPNINQGIRQFIIAMKIFLVLLAFSLQVSAAVFSQQITLSVKNEPLRDVLQSVRSQTGYSFLLQTKFLKQSNPVTLTLKEASLEVALNKIFENQPFGYVIKDRVIMVLPNVQNNGENSSLKGDEQNGQGKAIPIEIKGKVSDTTGRPLVGVNVRVKGTNIGTITDHNGEYKITADSDETLVFRYVGYQTTEIHINGKSVINVYLKELQSQLEETVIKGYYNTTKVLNTGSVSSVKAVDIAKQPVSDPLLALQGKVPGLYLYQNTGIPGTGITVRLRGQNSIENGNDPFYIVDGVPFSSTNLSQNTNATISNLSPFSSIRPEDIESIDVLKDADATAIYGSRGANGVILITTKKGKSGKTKANFNISNGIGQVSHMLDFMNTTEYLQMRKEAYANDGVTLPDHTTTPRFDNYDLTVYDQNRYTDWQKLFIGGTAHYTNAQASISGGNEQTQFLISGSYRNESTVFPGDFNNQIASGLVNINHVSENKRFHLDFSGNYSNAINKLPIIDFTNNITLAPNAPELYNANGNLNWENGAFDNPFATLYKKVTANTENLITNLSLSYSLSKDLQLKSSFGFSKMDLQEININPFIAYNPASSNPSSYRLNTTANNKVSSWIIDPQLNYKKEIGSHNFEALVGVTFQQNKQAGQQEKLSGFSSDDLIENPSAASTQVGIISNYSLYRYGALYGRVGYNYKEKYVLNLTGRRDGSSRFGPDKQFGNFGAIGAAWIFSKEEAFKLPSFISFGKIRVSLGKIGNDKLSDYEYLSTYVSPSTSYLGVSTLNPKSLTNPSYGWETINKVEVALETGFFQDRIYLNIDWYRNRTGNQLVGYSLPAITGFNNIRANLPAVIENRGLEFDLTTRNINRQNFSWTSSANLSIPKNKLIKYPNLENSSYAHRYVIGQPLFVQFRYKYQGVDPKTGVYTFEDLNKDGEITNTQDRVPIFSGQKWYGAITNQFNYKGLSFDFTIQYVKQIGSNFAKYFNPGSYFSGNQTIDLLNRWQRTDDIAQFEQYSQNYSSVANALNSLYDQSDAVVSDASFLRLKNVSVSWTIPKKWQQSIKAENVKVYLQGQNLFTITSFKGLDPEVQGVSSAPTLPSLRVIIAGVNFTF